MVFGPEPGAAEQRAGLLIIENADVLLFPAKSSIGFLGFVTCPYVLGRFLTLISDILETCDTEKSPWRDFVTPKKSILEDFKAITDKMLSNALADNEFVRDKKAFITKNSMLKSTDNKVYLLDGLVTIECEENDVLTELSKRISELVPSIPGYNVIRRYAETNLVLVSDKTFRTICERGLERTWRIRITPDTKTVVTGGLWNEEALPTWTLMFSPVLAARRVLIFSPEDEKRRGVESTRHILDMLSNSWHTLFFGGDETTGRGKCRVRIWPWGGA